MAETLQWQPGNLVHARGREWIVLPESGEKTLHLQPLGGSEEDKVEIFLPVEPSPVQQATFPPPVPTSSGPQISGLLLRDALMLKLRAGAGPFRSLGNLTIEPRAYQLVPLMMALKLPIIRLLIADDVGVGKTIEAGMIARELLDRGEIQRLVVLCPPHLCDQWQEELIDRFHIQAEIVRTSTAGRLERGLPAGRSIFEEYPFTVVSLDYIKSNRRRDEFERSCPEFVIVDEAHTCSQSGGNTRHQRYALLKALSDNSDRHIVLLTATPHSGNEEAFYNLLALLNPDFSQLQDLPQGEKDRSGIRERLANHFVQRRRVDIKEWQDATLFPERLTRETTYRLTGEWGQLFQDILEYARTMVERGEGLGARAQRMNWWAALALLRCASSSPRSAVQALRTRITAVLGETTTSDELEEIAARTILDGEGQDELTWDDTVPGADTGSGSREDADHLKVLLSYAEDLQGPKNDPKLKQLIHELKELVEKGFQPVVFCRYIATAHYLAEHLKQVKHFKKHTVIAVTGELTPAEREEKVHGLSEHEQRILVATDCLSEGINLQELFNAVIHYDLSWNPTRHEQREGRVDRFGQSAKEVRTTMLYGQDNPIDGAVLDVILRKAERIRKELGVLVPMPDDNNKVTEAILQSVLMRKGRMTTSNAQMSLDLSEIDREVDAKWESAREKAAKNRTIFAQNRLKPEEVVPELEKTVRVLGGSEDVRRFVTHAANQLKAPVTIEGGIHAGANKHNGTVYRLPVDHLELSLKERLQPYGIDKSIRITFTYPPASNCHYISRTHPLVTNFADYITEQALENANTEDSAASRTTAIRTDAVDTLTTIYLLRSRNQIKITRTDHRTKNSSQEKTMLAEEAIALSVVGDGMPQTLDSEETLRLMEAEPSGNLEPQMRERFLERSINAINKLAPHFEKIVKEKAQSLLEDHRRVRDASDARGRYSVEPILPVDVMGVYVLVPRPRL